MRLDSLLQVRFAFSDNLFISLYAVPPYIFSFKACRVCGRRASWIFRFLPTRTTLCNPSAPNSLAISSKSSSKAWFFDVTNSTRPPKHSSAAILPSREPMNDFPVPGGPWINANWCEETSLYAAAWNSSMLLMIASL